MAWTGSHISSVQDVAGRKVSYGYDAAGNLTSVTAVDGAITTFGYDGSHRLSSMVDPAQHGSATAKPITNVYDNQGHILTQTDQLGRVTQFAYTGDPFSATGGATVVTDPSGNERQDTYQYGLLITSVTGYGSAAAVTTQHTYDAATLAVTSLATSSATDPVVHVVTTANDAVGNPITTIDGVSRTTSRTFNTLHEPLTVTTPNPSATGPATVTTKYTYDAHGNLLSITSPLYTSSTAYTNRVTTYQHATAAHPQDVTGVVDPIGNVATNVYDAAGDLTGSTTASARNTTYTYDAVGRRITMVVPRGNVAGVNPASFTTAYTYDAANRLLTTSVAASPTPQMTKTTYDLDGRTVTSTDQLNRVTKNTYDLAGQLTQVTRPDTSTRQQAYFGDGILRSQTDGNAHSTTYTEDSLGRVSSVTDALNRTTAYTYDADGNVATLTDPQGQVTTNSYDAADDRISTTYSDAKTPPVTRTYNAADEPATMVDGTGTTTWTHDSLGRLTTSAAPAGTVIYGYNLRGSLTTMTYPNGKSITRGYDKDGLLASVTDWNNAKTAFTFGWDQQYVGGTSPDGVTTAQSHNNQDQTTSTTFTTGATTLGSLTYTPDAAAQITSETSVGLGPNQSFTYDTVGRIKTENTATYNYDNTDNITTNATTTQTYDNANQLTTSSGGTSYTYDSRGNRITSTTGTATTTYTYDQSNRLTAYTKGTVTAKYTYNGDGLRATKTIGGTATAFTYDTVDGLPIILTDGSTNYINGPNGTPVEAIDITGTTTYLHADQLGSIRLLTRAGTTVGTASYTAYGTPTTSGVTTPFGYAGQYTDTETGLIWLHARYYDPTTAQFINLDPAASFSHAPYSYADLNPVSTTDVAGLWGWRETFEATAVVLAVGATVASFGAGAPVLALTVGSFTVEAETALTLASVAVDGGFVTNDCLLAPSAADCTQSAVNLTFDAGGAPLFRWGFEKVMSDGLGPAGIAVMRTVSDRLTTVGFGATTVLTTAGTWLDRLVQDHVGYPGPIQAGSGIPC